ncbi:STY1053 family phage-associated protein [Xenorhabdus budapestensis]|uniref:STY1053 family phage-associated protein n=1 Tax=Xenorhabdus budapestensis TaxID=290110 RepID=UPI003A87EE9A
MKRYMVTQRATLSFPSGQDVQLSPGIHTFDDDVIQHWAFSCYATPLDDTGQPDDKKGKTNGKKQSSADS